jgi:hypothetical protein
MAQAVILTTPSNGNGDSTEQNINMVEVVIEENSIPVDTSFNGSFEGQLHCSARLLLNLGIFVDSVDVYLEVQYPEEISVSLDDYEFTLTPEEPVYEFMANVTVQPGTSSTKNPQVTIGGSATAQPSGRRGGVIEDQASVDILPFYTADIEFEISSSTINKGDSKEFKLILENKGNADETFVLNWANPDELSGKDIKVEMEDTNIFVPEKSKVEVDIKIKTGDRTSRGSYLIKIELWSERNGPANKEESRADIIIDVKDPYLEGIQDFFSMSPYVVYITGAVVLIAVAIVIYLLLRWRSSRAWKRRLDEYRSMEDDEQYPAREQEGTGGYVQENT